ncbi:MAG: DMT family transporter [Alphaproteobacteria bacterium]|nr:DMT family transporter [Alphaproteobacteria bacterium]
MPVRFYPVIFVVLWASAFVSAKYGMMGAGPFSFLFTRFVIVMGLFGVMAVVMRSRWPRRQDMAPTLIAGVLMHGVYLGGVFYAVSLGTPAGIASLIVSIQPIITAFLALVVLGEVIRRLQWLGIALGMIGVVLVISPRLGGEVPAVGLLSCLISVYAMSVGTIVQKRYLGQIDLVSGNALQAMAAAAFYGFLLLTVENYQLEWTLEVTLSMIWIVSAVSIGAVTILMLLIRSGQMAATSSLFFMVPPVSALMGYVAFGEVLGAMGILGFIIASAGVWLVNRPEKP